MIIEVFKFSLNGKRPSNSKLRIDQIDHKFQVIKAKWENVKCLMCVKFSRNVHPTTVELLKLDLLNTDTFLVNEEIEKVGKIVKSMLES